MSLNLVNSILRAGPALPLSVAERLCLIVLAYRADENGWTGLSKAGLARQTGQSKPTILNAVRRLGYMGLLESPKPLTLDVSALTKAIQRAMDFDDDADDRPAWLGRKGKKVAQKGKENLYQNGQDFDHSDPQNDSAEGKKPLPFSVKNEDL